jgi:hypothetical protein
MKHVELFPERLMVLLTSWNCGISGHSEEIQLGNVCKLSLCGYVTMQSAQRAHQAAYMFGFLELQNACITEHVKLIPVPASTRHSMEAEKPHKSFINFTTLLRPNRLAKEI